MPIERITGGKDFRKAGKEVKNKINEIVDWINQREKAKVTPSSNVGALRQDGTIDLTQISNRVTQLESR